ncbi:MAG TPA: hypothetical protein VFW82_10235, partial [Dyella sp.]|nr:hypothetical protein [Dyella sp.]
AESPTPLPDAQMADWSHWALEQAERIDPVETLAFLQPVPEEKSDEPASALSGHNPASPPEPAAPSPEWHPNRWYTRLHR